MATFPSHEPRSGGGRAGRQQAPSQQQAKQAARSNQAPPAQQRLCHQSIAKKEKTPRVSPSCVVASPTQSAPPSRHHATTSSPSPSRHHVISRQYIVIYRHISPSRHRAITIAITPATSSSSSPSPSPSSRRGLSLPREGAWIPSSLLFWGSPKNWGFRPTFSVLRRRRRAEQQPPHPARILAFQPECNPPGPHHGRATLPVPLPSGRASRHRWRSSWGRSRGAWRPQRTLLPVPPTRGGTARQH